ncbi:MAG: GDP-mannose 4,6-dehydratase, partial [Amylibacter sp.]
LAAAKELDMNITFEGEGVDEVGRDASGNVIVAVDERYFRPTEVETLLGDASKAKEKLGWTPQTSFEELVAEMVKADFDEAKQDNLRAL